MGWCTVRALAAAAALLFAWGAGAQIAISAGDKKSAGAKKSASAEASAFARAWRRMPPPDINASHLAISPGGDVYATGRGGLFRWNKVKFEWEIITGAFKPRRIAISRRGGQDLIFGVAPTVGGDWLFSSGKELVWKPSVRAKDVAVDGNGLPVIVNPSGAILRWSPKQRGWVLVPVAGKALRIAVSADDAIWAVTEEGAIVRSDGKPVEQVPGGAKDIARRGNTMLVASASGQLQRWNERGRRWEGETFAPLDVAVMVVAPNGDGWAATSRGVVHTQAPVTAPKKKDEPLIAQQPVGSGVKFKSSKIARGASGARAAKSFGPRAARAGGALVALELPGARTDTAPFVFVDTNATGTFLAIGPEGSIFERTVANTLARWSNQRNAFVSFPGSVVRFAADRGGNLWGVNSGGAIYRHTGTDWLQVAGTASDIAIAANGTLMIIDENRLLRRFLPERSLFELVPGPVSGLTQLALAPDGVPWGLRGNTVVRCAAVPCESFLDVTARSLSIGPDGSVFVVTLTNELRRFNTEARKFDELVPLPQPHVPASVAVGPGGRPWVITAQNRILRTNLFPRDETADQRTINTTATATTAAPVSATGGTGATVAVAGGFGGFQFSKSMTFISMSVVPPCLGDMQGFGIGHDGTVMVVCDPPPIQKLLRLSSDFKTFTQLTAVPTTEIHHVDVDSEGRIWLTDATVNGRIYRETKKGSNAYQTIQLNVPVVVTPPPHNRALAIANDDTVYFIDSGGNLYRKPKDSNTFTKLINGVFEHVAVGGQNDLWVIDGLTFGLFQLVNGQLVARQAVSNPSIIDVAGGPDGSIYISEANMDSMPTPTVHMYKWVGPSLRFDRINTVEPFRIQVNRDGRPWFFDAIDLTKLYRAK